MLSTLSPAARCRAFLAAAALGLLAVTGCGSGGDGSEAGSSSESSDTKRVSAVGISFEVPEGWEELAAEDVAEGIGESSEIGELADRLGMTPDQFEQLMGTIDLFLFSDEGARHGFLDNVNVLQAGDRMPNDEQLKLQLLQFGADVGEISHEQTELGEVTLASYEADLAGSTVQGQGLYVDVGDGPVAVTVSSSDRDTADEIAEGILESLAEAS